MKNYLIFFLIFLFLHITFPLQINYWFSTYIEILRFRENAERDCEVVVWWLLRCSTLPTRLYTRRVAYKWRRYPHRSLRANQEILLLSNKSKQKIKEVPINVEIQVHHFVSESLQFVRIEVGVVENDIVVGEDRHSITPRLSTQQV